jgi:RNA polymerase sigma factor (sigma-70 family)
MDAPSTERLPSDYQLLLACRNGDSQGWSLLLDKYERLVYSIPLNYGLSRDDAADIAQVVFVSLLNSLDELRDDSNLSAWLATVARRHSWRVLARTRRHYAVPLDDNEGIQALLPRNASEIERWELTEWLHSSLAMLDERCQQLLLTLYFDAQELSYAEVAAALGMAEGSVGPTRARCLQRLQKVMTTGH